MYLRRTKFLLVKIFLIILILQSKFVVLAATPVNDFRLNIMINHADDFTLSLGNVAVEQGPSVSYGLDYPNNYYLIKIVTIENMELFSGKTLKSYKTYYPHSKVDPVTDFKEEIVIPNPINLLLPYFNEATKVQIFDENNVLKLEIVLADHNLQGLMNRYIACDLCGYCPGSKTPSSWESCRQCLYPKANKDPASGDTVRITDPASNIGPTTQPEKEYTGIGCIYSSPEKNSQSILNIISSIAGGVAFLYLLYGGFIVTTSQADPERLNYGKSIIKGSIIGLIVTLFSVFIINLIATGILRIPGFG